jgi:hypothetical protein
VLAKYSKVPVTDAAGGALLRIGQAPSATVLSNHLFSAHLHRRHRDGGVWQQVQRLHEDVLASALCLNLEMSAM